MNRLKFMAMLAVTLGLMALGELSPLPAAGADGAAEAQPMAPGLPVKADLDRRG
jgi:hypothetical protein